jgi:hypothetical protein
MSQGAIAVEDETDVILTRLGQRTVQRRAREALHPDLLAGALMSRSTERSGCPRGKDVRGGGNAWLLTDMLLSSRTIERLWADASDGNGLPESRLGSVGNFEALAEGGGGWDGPQRL